MTLIHYPNPILETPCIPINKEDNIEQLIKDMTEVMIKHNGVGLAAPQVGLSKQLFIIKDIKGNIVPFINPKIIETDGQTILNEGCLSFPNIFLPVVRASSVFIEIDSIDLLERRRIMAEGIEARIILHEFQHLKGETFLNSVNRQLRKSTIAKMRKT